MEEQEGRQDIKNHLDNPEAQTYPEYVAGMPGMFLRYINLPES